MSSIAFQRTQAQESGAIEYYLSAFRATRHLLPGSGMPWMQRLRDRAAGCLAEQGFPTRRWEDWKYTDLQPLVKRRFEPTGPGATGLAREHIESRLIPGETQLLVFVDGWFAPGLSSVDSLPEGVVIQPLTQALPSHVDVIESRLARLADMASNPLVALNTMLMSDGAFIHLSAQAKIDVPIYLLHLNLADGGTSQLRHLVLAEEGSEAVIIEHYVSANEVTCWTNTVTEIDLACNAGIEHYKLQEEGGKALHIASVDIDQDRDSRFTSHNINLGGRLVRNDVNARLDGEDAHSVLNGLYVLNGRQHVDNHTRIDHLKPRTVSRELYKGVLDGWSRGVFNGKIIVHKDAQLTDSSQSNHNLLLSQNAEVDPKPQLEIFADDVKCAHGATVGQLDEDALYYLRSRGVPLQEARALLTFAFANDVITHMRLEPMRERLEGLLRQRLPAAEVVQA